MKIMTLRVKGIIRPASAARHIVLSSSLTAWDIRGGVASSGAAPIARVEVSIDNDSWQEARLIGDRHRRSWQWRELLTNLTQPGTHSIRARATDLAGPYPARPAPMEPPWLRQQPHTASARAGPTQTGAAAYRQAERPVLWQSR